MKAGCHPEAFSSILGDFQFLREQGGELAGLSTPFADCMNHRYSYSAEVFTHLSDFVAKANTAVASGTKFNIT